MSGAPPPPCSAWCSMRPERTGFSPGAGTSAAASARVSRQARRPFAACACLLLHAPAFCCTRLKSAKNLYLSHRFFCKIRQIHRFFCIFRQKLQILCRNQARGSWDKSRRKQEQSRRIYEPEMNTKSEQKYSDKARKSGKSLRLDAHFELQQNYASLMHFSGCCKSISAPCASSAWVSRQANKKRSDRSLTSPVSNVGWTYLRVTVAPASSS